MGYDAVLIPGGGVRAGGVLPAWVAARFDAALQAAGDAMLVPLSGGTPHRPPPLDADGFPITEAAAGAQYLLARGVAAERIAAEAVSLDTIGNAYFSRVMHVIPRGWQRLLVITSAFHMPRTEAVFRWVYGLDGPGPVASLEFLSVPDVGIAAAALARRVEKERASLASLAQLQARVGSLEELHRWLFAEHGAYRAGAVFGGAPEADAESY